MIELNWNLRGLGSTLKYKMLKFEEGSGRKEGKLLFVYSNDNGGILTCSWKMYAL